MKDFKPYIKAEFKNIFLKKLAALQIANQIIAYKK